jgi:protein arginine N-methyltransferase 1
VSEYTVADYVGMLGDRERVEAYTAALRRHVRPESVVVDLGAGTGAFALLAAKLGARRVHAIEPNAAITTLPELARRNGVADRIVVHHEKASEVTLPERADLIVSDVRGTLPFLGPSLSVVIDARDRFLAPGGTLLPARDAIRAAPLTGAAMLDARARPWRLGPWFDGVDLEPLARFATSQWGRGTIKESDLAAPAVTLATIDYRTTTTDALHGGGSWEAAKDGALAGFAVWFDATIDEGLGYSNAPPVRETSVYGCAYFPVGDAMRLRAGDAIELRMSAVPSADEHLFTWRTTVRSPGEPDRADEQSTFFAGAVAKPALERRAESFRPGAGEALVVERAALEHFGTGETLGDIARALEARFPARFASYARALDYVGDLSARLGGGT